MLHLASARPGLGSEPSQAELAMDKGICSVCLVWYWKFY